MTPRPPSAKSRPILTWSAVCAFLEKFPGCEQDPPGGREVVRVSGKPVAYPARNERSRPDGIPDDEELVVIKIPREDREALLYQGPESFFVTPHYRNYPGVIVRLSTVDQGDLRDLLTDAWRMTAQALRK